MDVGCSSGGAQFFPKEGDDKRVYSPHRDLAWVTPGLMQLTTNSFYTDAVAYAELMKLIEDKTRVLDITFGYAPTSEELVEKFREMCIAIGKDFCQGFLRGGRTFTDAWDAARLPDRFPKWMLDLWLKHFGHTMMSAFYYGVRDVLIKGHKDPMNWDNIFDAAEDIRRKISGR